MPTPTASRAQADWNRDNSFRRPPMKHQLPKPSFVAFAKMTHLKIYACVSLILLPGCAVLDTHQAKLDQKQLREVLMDYNQDQILDNLIRARNGLPIVHYD